MTTTTGGSAPNTAPIARTAVLSPCGTYRYTLRRGFCTPGLAHDYRPKPCLFIMLNPSTADAFVDDPTIRRCIGFAQRENCTSMTVVNLFALRATDPSALRTHPDPIGPHNLAHLAVQMHQHRSDGVIIAAWGANPLARSQPHLQGVRTSLVDTGALCLGMTADGSPRHPLYVKADQPLVPWTGVAR